MIENDSVYLIQAKIKSEGFMGKVVPLEVNV
jgi:hypothetical protein